MQALIGEAVGESGAAHFVDASDLALRLLGDSIAGNLFLLGYAWQKGIVPVSWEAIDRAIELNGTAVAMSRAAFLWGRRAAHGSGGRGSPCAGRKSPCRQRRLSTN
jgi:indolepyruvate ferredoxin oxidoreductase